MSGYSHLTAERDRLAGLMADGLSLRSIAKALGRATSTISRELRRNALDGGAYRPHVADGAYMLRRQRTAALEDGCQARGLCHGPAQRRLDARADRRTAAPRDRGRPAGGLRREAEIYGWIYRAGQKTGRLWRYLTRRHARRRKRHARASRDTIAEKTHISARRI